MNDEGTTECDIISIASHRDFSPKAEGEIKRREIARQLKENE